MSFDDLVKELTQPAQPEERKPFDYHAAKKMLDEYFPAPEMFVLVVPPREYHDLWTQITPTSRWNPDEPGFRYIAIGGYQVLCWEELDKPMIVPKAELWKREYDKLSALEKSLRNELMLKRQEVRNCRDRIRQLEQQLLSAHKALDGDFGEPDPPEQEETPAD